MAWSVARSAGSSARDVRSCVRSRGRAERRATRARIRSISPMPCEMLANAFEAAAVDEGAERLVAAAQCGLIRQRAIEPATQLARAHGRDALVDQGEERRIRVS